MGSPQAPDPALLVVSVLFSDEAVVQAAQERLGAVLGELRPAAEDQPFSWTEYYQREMGPGLRRRFLVAQRLVPRELLPEIKRFTNHVEGVFSRPDGSRRVNLDPGLLTLGNFVLASTKNNAHRIYLREGIFAEVTLRFVHGDFVPLDWTYPDYASDEVRALLRSLRSTYQQDLHGAPALVEKRAFPQEVLS